MYYYDVEHLRNETRLFMLNNSMSMIELAKNTKIVPGTISQFITKGKGLNVKNAFSIMNFIGFEPLQTDSVPNVTKKQFFGARLAKIRKQRGYTQKQLAECIGCTHTFISYIENMDECKLSLEQAEKVARFLNIDHKELA